MKPRPALAPALALVALAALAGCGGSFVPVETDRTVEAMARGYAADDEEPRALLETATVIGPDGSVGLVGPDGSVGPDEQAGPAAAALAPQAERAIGEGEIAPDGRFSFAYHEEVEADLLLPMPAWLALPLDCTAVSVSDQGARVVGSYRILVEGGGVLEQLSFDPAVVPSAYTQMARLYADRPVSVDGDCLEGDTTTSFRMDLTAGWNRYTLSVNPNSVAYVTEPPSTALAWYFEPAGLAPAGLASAALQGGAARPIPRR